MATKKAVIIGLGSLGYGAWYKAIKEHPDWDIIGVVDTDTELLENVPNIIPTLTEDDAFMSIDDMVSMSDKGKPDLAIIATPIYTHHILTTETMDLGINVICEKNMASTAYQARQMLQAALDNPTLSTAIGTNYRFQTQYWTAHKYFALKDRTDAPDIGDISFIRWASGGNWGEKRRGWRRWLQEVYLEDMCTHWFDMLRFITGMDVVQVKADTFIPKYSSWKGSSTTFVNLALAHPDDYNHRHNWVWVQLYGDWQRRGPGMNKFEFFCEKGQAELSGAWGLEMKVYEDDEGHKWEEDGYMPQGDVLNLGTSYTSQTHMLEQMKISIDSKGQKQPNTNFAEAYKSFVVSMAAIESSRTGKTVWVPDYWKDLPI